MTAVWVGMKESGRFAIPHPLQKRKGWGTRSVRRLGLDGGHGVYGAEDIVGVGVEDYGAVLGGFVVG